VLRLYKDAQPIGRREIALDDDAESVVRIGPADPWDKTRRFSGEVRNLTIWPAALPREALEALQKADADRAASAK